MGAEELILPAPWVRSHDRVPDYVHITHPHAGHFPGQLTSKPVAPAVPAGTNLPIGG